MRRLGRGGGRGAREGTLLYAADARLEWWGGSVGAQWSCRRTTPTSIDRLWLWTIAGEGVEGGCGEEEGGGAGRAGEVRRRR